MHPLSIILTIVVWCGCAPVLTWADDAVPSPVGTTPQRTSVERLTARSLDGQAVSFADLLGGDGKAVCYAFLHPTCPLAQRYGPVLVELDKEFNERGIRFVGVVCEFDDVDEITRESIRAMKRSARALEAKQDAD
jgi:thiol-disulfide isomerase/thioredoxin